MILVITPAKTWQKIEVIHLVDGSDEQKRQAYGYVMAAFEESQADNDRLDIALTDIQYIGNWIRNNVDKRGFRRWFVRYAVTRFERG